ncbi:MAG TPA: hypothetical protein PLC15_00235 [Candidatus Obscuribacter sp.]|nr:hypothetical protein [Candidatus Obscuribacter sp.]HMW91400.1 hypothetical protein [Candidatus Obscuribacter sp.]HMX45052.1 hypothetical protein [Candidatus Obscuribacter sp.]HMY03204.1 hypothetical protein [Candidatus Obscuribacter sp.]HMY54618.1 hypothetical protein [Candidatus Obscuribacter sp.]
MHESNGLSDRRRDVLAQVAAPCLNPSLRSQQCKRRPSAKILTISATLLLLALSSLITPGLTCSCEAKPSQADEAQYREAVKLWEHDIDSGEKALTMLDRLLARNPDCLTYLRTKALWLIDFKRDEEALVFVERALRVNPKDKGCLELHAKLLFRGPKNRWPEALKSATLACEGGQDSSLYETKSEIEIKMGDLNSAEATLTQGIKNMPRSRDLKLDRARVRMKKRDWRGVVQDTSTILDDWHPGLLSINRQCTSMKLKALQELNDKAGLEAEFKKVLSRDKNDRLNLSEAKKYFEKKGDKKSAAQAEKWLKEFDNYYVP